ncbi:MAG: hypothetical protein A2589_02330 [Candidatus Vogelbacteria bacterium RIFOXYD1_FULL_46_19]|uniref:Glycosyl transferase family 1 domain-containing protein n=1 Tax=Candidatus Vogelbacteria bacterium RIFOXYD1_FULL_46_19 TaxID=1802439 RepID=A0A1G2QI76_9BACT|nr:MAG: hypothetical protein A2589_02330 [Candidatus Vogelbacteria bacterium RIFOXYD1_FULL_46_19]
MKIVIATPLYPPDIGGPATYVKNLEKAWKDKGENVIVVGFGEFLKWPVIIRHILYLVRLGRKIRGADCILALDTFSVGLPAAVVSFLFGKKLIIRIGGDFLWESFVERTQTRIQLSEFYKKNFRVSFKDKVVFFITKKVIKAASCVVFSTEWQSGIWQGPYEIPRSKIVIIQNSFVFSRAGLGLNNQGLAEKVFITAGRDIFLKNLSGLKEAFSQAQIKDKTLKLKILNQQSQEDLFREIKNCYAVIIPSFSEVSPNLALEAASFNKPVVLTKDNGIKDIMKDGALYVDPFDANDISDKILLMADVCHYKQCQENISKFSLTWSYDDIVRQFEQLI